jgi:phage anti-repressor protein
MGYTLKYLLLCSNCHREFHRHIWFFSDIQKKYEARVERQKQYFKQVEEFFALKADQDSNKSLDALAYAVSLDTLKKHRALSNLDGSVEE